MQIPHITHRYVDLDGVRVFYRETGPVNGLPLLLLHGFPTASHQFRGLMTALGTRFHLIAPDYPGFGHTRVPDGFAYSFEALADVLDGFVRELGLTRFAMYMFDFGGPVGMRLATRDPHRIAGIIVQNANAYVEGLSHQAKQFINHATDQTLRENLLTEAATRAQYEEGATDGTLIDPDGWTLDQHLLELPGRKDAQVALALDYRSNVTEYPGWQAWLREHQPATLVLWGRHDPFFPESGAHAYRRDVPDAQVHLFETGHFALEEHLPEISPLVADFLETVSILRIAVIGGTGRLGGAVARAASSRGHQVTPLSSADVDVTDPVSIHKVTSGCDVVIVAVKGGDRVVPRGAQAALDAEVTRLLFVGGGASLHNEAGGRYLDAPGFPEQYRQTAQDQTEALQILRDSDADTEWTYVSPPPIDLFDGPATGRYRAEARDTPITDATGRSRISVEDFAHAVVDAVEHRSFVRQRITVAY